MPGRRGSQALKFFNSHQIKCSLEKHSTAPSSVSNWKGGPLRIDPLATLQTLERYLVVRGIGMSDQAAKRLEDIEFGDEVEENMIVAHMPTTDRHYLEFLISDQVVPYNMTIFQAVRQFAVSQAQEFEDEAMPLGRPEIWIRTHTIHYRPVVPPPGAGSSKVMSTSLPSSTHLATSTASASPAPKKSSSSGSGRKRTSSAKTPLSVPTLFPRVTRSSSRDKSGSGAQPSPPLRPFRSPSLPTPPLPTKAPPAPNPPPTTKSPERVASKKSPSVGPASKEKQRRYGGGLSPLHQALKQSTELSLSSEDPSLPLLRLLKILYSINNHWRPTWSCQYTSYVHSPVGLFPSPLGPSASYPKVEEICSKFKFLGKFIAKAVMDSRMLDVPLSDAFYKWMLGQQGMFTAQDLQHVDPVVARSFAQLAAVAVNKHKLESDPLLSDKALSMGIEALSLDGGGSIDDLDLDFTLPGYPDIELKPGGKDVAVNIHNLDEYLKLVVDWTLVRGVARQVEAFKEGVASVLPLSSLHTFYPSEMDMLLCGANHQKWDVKELMDCCRPDHGYSHDSATVQNLFEVLSTYDTLEQRQFIQFVTGSPETASRRFQGTQPSTDDSPKDGRVTTERGRLPSLCHDVCQLPQVAQLLHGRSDEREAWFCSERRERLFPSLLT
ncbi:E3 ubiquitin-protein ligase TRIP12 [Geodia barretti]|uniref:E3 ubiquitin-protein ligase n=1 Tax=Geodia barretti TaxID=519541 RepID=A0AA35VVL6_GEOBA|nr:E3 ubiquitin-protein ligase TRIP12 [Geodia barretti]